MAGPTDRQGQQPTDHLERLSRIATLVAAALASVAAVGALLLAIAFAKVPFPGVLVEQSLVATHHDGADWSARRAGLGHPHRLVRIAGQPVHSPVELRRVLGEHAVGERVSVLSVLPDGRQQLFPDVRLGTFGWRDGARYFLLPYAIGVAYLAIGLWVYRVSGRSRPGRVLAFFCFCTAIVCILLFDLTSTHVGSVLWTTALALSAGALLSLAMRFPQPWGPVRRRSWLLAIPYVTSILLAAWAVHYLASSARPWAYIEPWGAIYRYNGLAIVLFLAVMLHRARSGGTRLYRQQARIVLAGSAASFLPVTVWFVAPILGTELRFDPILFLPSLIVFPLALMVAIARYRLLDMELIVSHTLLYGALTAVLAGVFAVSITISQKAFTAITGERRDAAIVLTTLVVVAVVTPLKTRLQAFLDRAFKEGVGEAASLQRFGQQVRFFDQLTHADEIARAFAVAATESLGAESAVLRLHVDGAWRTLHTVGDWRGETWMAVPLRCRGVQEGILLLGRRSARRGYTQQEARDLEDLGDYVIRSMRLASALRRVTGLEGKALE